MSMFEGTRTAAVLMALSLIIVGCTPSNSDPTSTTSTTAIPSSTTIQSVEAADVDGVWVLESFVGGGTEGNVDPWVQAEAGRTVPWIELDDGSISGFLGCNVIGWWGSPSYWVEGDVLYLGDVFWTELGCPDVDSSGEPAFIEALTEAGTGITVGRPDADRMVWSATDVALSFRRVERRPAEDLSDVPPHPGSPTEPFEAFVFPPAARAGDLVEVCAPVSPEVPTKVYLRSEEFSDYDTEAVVSRSGVATTCWKVSIPERIEVVDGSHHSYHLVEPGPAVFVVSPVGEYSGAALFDVVAERVERPMTPAPGLYGAGEGQPWAVAVSAAHASGVDVRFHGDGGVVDLTLPVVGDVREGAGVHVWFHPDAVPSTDPFTVRAIPGYEFIDWEADTYWDSDWLIERAENAEVPVAMPHAFRVAMVSFRDMLPTHFGTVRNDRAAAGGALWLYDRETDSVVDIYLSYDPAGEAAVPDRWEFRDADDHVNSVDVEATNGPYTVSLVTVRQLSEGEIDAGADPTPALTTEDMDRIVRQVTGSWDSWATNPDNPGQGLDELLGPEALWDSFLFRVLGNADARIDGPVTGSRLPDGYVSPEDGRPIALGDGWIDVLYRDEAEVAALIDEDPGSFANLDGDIALFWAGGSTHWFCLGAGFSAESLPETIRPFAEAVCHNPDSM